ncbi:redoxin domain-containing protein [Leptolyngbya sp. FACHB-16]|nr:redoxin domain-containing protein [Leptolyngbya sp. FACHB-8]MBD2157255.1 redoxin domain-containing protein [Leptolyngbya sp. FACHB-16]
MDVGRLFNRRFFRNLLPFPASNHFFLGSLAPPFELLDAQTDLRIRLMDWVGTRPTDPPVQKRPVLLYFTRIFSEKVYCPLCYPHIMELNQRYEEFAQRGAEVFLITSIDLPQSKTVVRDLGLKMPVLSDPSCRIFRLYQVGQALGAPLPAQFWIDAKGRIRFRHLFSFLEPNASVDRLVVALDRIRSGRQPEPQSSVAPVKSDVPIKSDDIKVPGSTEMGELADVGTQVNGV